MTLDKTISKTKSSCCMRDVCIPRMHPTWSNRPSIISHWKGSRNKPGNRLKREHATTNKAWMNNSPSPFSRTLLPANCPFPSEVLMSPNLIQKLPTHELRNQRFPWRTTSLFVYPEIYYGTLASLLEVLQRFLKLWILLNKLAYCFVPH
jgi:hypothetical protein